MDARTDKRVGLPTRMVSLRFGHDWRPLSREINLPNFYRHYFRAPLRPSRSLVLAHGETRLICAKVCGLGWFDTDDSVRRMGLYHLYR
jgi:hypothetical protein